MNTISPNNNGALGKVAVRRAIMDALNRAHLMEAGVDFDRARFVAARDHVVSKRHGSALRGWRVALFAFLYRNSAKIVDRFNLPPERVVEIARQIEI